jgi:pimeloyl-ACP methyl ester carboxylesterase
MSTASTAVTGRPPSLPMRAMTRPGGPRFTLAHSITALAAVFLSYGSAVAGPPDAPVQTAPWQTLPTPTPLPPARTSGWAPVNGISMYFAVYGRGSPILLVHNGLGSADDWGDVVPLLSQHHTVVVADTRGFGRSTRSLQPYSYELLADDYVKLLDFLKFRRVFLAGTSDGGIIGLEIAIHHPERLTGLFVQGANTNGSGVQPVAALDSTAIRLALARSAADYQRLSRTPNDYKNFRAAVDAMPEPDISTDQLASIRVPVTVGRSDHEESIKPEHTRYIAGAIPGARLVVLHGVSHFAPLQDSRQYAEAIGAAERWAAGH